MNKPGKTHRVARRASASPGKTDTETRTTRMIVRVDPDTYERIRRWQNDPNYGEMPYEALYPGGDPEEVDAIVWPTGQDPDLDQPIVNEVELHPRPDDKGYVRVRVPVKQSDGYRAHLRRLASLMDRGYEHVLLEIERVVSPRRGVEPPPDSRYLWDDWREFWPGYVRRFNRQTSAWLRSSSVEQRSLAKRGERAIAKLTTRGRDKTRGRRPEPPKKTSVATQASLRAEVPALRKAVRDVLRLHQDGATQEAVHALSDIVRRATGRPREWCRDRARKLLRAPKKPQYLVNQVLAWKSSLRPADVQRMIAGAR